MILFILYIYIYLILCVNMIWGSVNMTRVPFQIDMGGLSFRCVYYTIFNRFADPFHIDMGYALTRTNMTWVG